MTPEDIDKMEAGREMDKLITSTIFPDDAFPWHEHCDYSGCFRCLRNCDHYTADIAAAWQVLEELQRQDKLGDFSEACPICDSTAWAWCGYSGSEMALVICKAALKAAITVTCAACQQSVKPWKSVKEYEWRFCFACHHELAMTDIEVRGRDRRGIFERAVLKAQQPEGAGKCN